jgi:hypothetical protein
MNSVEHFIEHVPWTHNEKTVARRAFDLAFERECASVKTDVEKMMKSFADPSDIWRVHDYLSERRRQVAAVYKYSYSDLLSVFALLFRDGWLEESDLTGLQQDKIDRIKLWAKH